MPGPAAGAGAAAAGAGAGAAGAGARLPERARGAAAAAGAGAASSAGAGASSCGRSAGASAARAPAALVADARERGPDGDRLVLLDEDLLQDAGERRRDLGVDLVGRDLQQRLVDLDAVADVLEPAGDGALGDALAEFREDDVLARPCGSRAERARRLRRGCAGARRRAGASAAEPAGSRGGLLGRGRLSARAASAAVRPAAGGVILAGAEPAPIRRRSSRGSAPTSTVSSSWTRISSITPLTGDGISVSTLSVEISSSPSSASTVSPTFLSQRVTVPSVTLSPSAGRTTEVLMCMTPSECRCRF